MATGGNESRRISFDFVDSDRLIARDDVKGVEMEFNVAGTPELESALTDLFLFPVDGAVSLRTDRVEVQPQTHTSVRNESGEHLGHFEPEPRHLDRGTYFLGVQGHVKAYLRIPDVALTGVTVDDTDERRSVTIELDEPRPIAIGVRSLYSGPRATITVPDDPHDLIRALPYLAASMKEFSVERSWPTLRDHPPTIETGARLRIPSKLDRPDVGVTVAVPPTLADVYRVAPLAYYLGADVVAAEEPELRLENGFVEPLRGPDRALAESVDELRSRCLLLDSLVRGDGYFSFPRLEYDEIAEGLPFYPPNLYGASLSDQLMEYLEVDRSLIEPYRPEWPSTAVLRERHADAVYLPHLLNTLSSVRVGDDPAPICDGSPLHAVGYTNPDPPNGTTRLAVEAFENGLDRRVPGPDEVTFGLFAADANGADGLREVASRLRDAQEVAPDRVTVLERPTRSEARDALAGLDFLYSELPQTGDGLACADGSLRPSSVPAPDLVVLAGDASLDAGTAFVREGTVGVVAAAEPLSPTELGRITRSLARKHTLWTSTQLADLGTPHRFVGAVTQSLIDYESGQQPTLVDVESRSEDEYGLTVRSQPTESTAVGGTTQNLWEHATDAYQLVGAAPPQPFTFSTYRVVDVLEDEDYVVRVDGRPYHGETSTPREFLRRPARRTADDESSP